MSSSRAVLDVLNGYVEILPTLERRSGIKSIVRHIEGDIRYFVEDDDPMLAAVIELREKVERLEITDPREVLSSLVARARRLSTPDEGHQSHRSEQGA